MLSMGEDVDQLELLPFAVGNTKCTTMLENTSAASCKVKCKLYNSAIPLLGIYPSEMKVQVP